MSGSETCVVAKCEFTLVVSHFAKYYSVCIRYSLYRGGHPVVVIAISRLRDFWLTFPEAETPLRAWYKVAQSAEWAKFADVRATFGNASPVGYCTIFNIAGNKYRLATRVHYKTRTVYVLRFMTHTEYDDQEQWQDDCGCHKPPPRRKKKSDPKRRI